MNLRTSLNGTTTSKTTSLYRQLQLVCIQYRINYSRYMIGSIMPCFLSMSVICLYNTIIKISGRSANGSWGYSVLYAWSGMICILNILFMFGILADVYNVSHKVLQRLEANEEFRKHIFFRRWLKSCPTLKIYFGGSNFLDRHTPLNLQNFVIEQTVSLLLLKN